MGFCMKKWRLLRHKLKKRWMTIAWLAMCLGIFYVEYMRYKKDPRYYYLRRMLGEYMCISRGTAGVLNLSCCFIVIPMCRALATSLSSAFQYFMSLARSEYQNRSPSLPFFLTCRATQTAKSVHTMIAVTVIISSSLHTCAHIGNAVNFSRYYCNEYPEINVAAYKGQNPFHLIVKTVPGITGLAMTIVLLALTFTSTGWARSRNYNAFFYTHHLGLLFLVLLLIHPLRGILKEQKNIDDHIPGCNMSGILNAEKELPEPEPEPVEYFENANNETSLNKLQAAFYQSSFRSSSKNLTYRDFDSRITPSGSSNDTRHDGAEQGSEVKLYIWREACSEPPHFQSIHSQTWIWISVAFMLWIADSIFRWWRQRNSVNIVSVFHHPCDVIQLTFQQSGFSCKPGQYVLLQCPTISRFEWHPFTVTCPPSQHCDTFTILMRIRGDWSRKFADIFPSSESDHHLNSHFMTNRTNSFYYPVRREFNLTDNKLNNNTGESVDRDIRQNFCTHGIYECEIPKASSGSPINPFYHVQSTKKSNSYSFSPKEYNNKNLELFNHTLLHNNGNCIHSEFLFSNLLLLQDNRSSLPNSYGLLSSYPNYKHKNTDGQVIQKFYHKSKLVTMSGCQGCEKYDARSNCRKCFIRNNNRLKNGIRNSTTCLCKEARKISQTCTCRVNSSNTENIKEDKKDHIVNISSSFYPRLCIDGPFNSPSVEMLHYPIIIGAAGGIGITPLASTLSHKIWHPTKWPSRIHMVWVVRDARLLLVIAPLLSSLLLHCWQANMEDSIELRLHVTIPTSLQDLQDLFAEKYPSLLPRITQGRPQWKHLFQEWRQLYKRKKVGVFTCGPPKMCSQVKRHCSQAVIKGVDFNYHQESFS